MSGTLVLCATPIGNLSDASPRLREALDSADIVYCEDTRRSQKLLAALGIKATLRSYFVANEATRARELAGRLEQGETVVLITDAGMPGVADPGLTAVRAATEVGAAVTVVPGPSAVTAAIAVSGLPSERFVFEGFLPRKQQARIAYLDELSSEPRTMVFFLAPSRAAIELSELADACGANRPVVVARELTKLHEEVWRGTLIQAATHFAGHSPRGELTAVVGGAPSEPGDLAAAVTAVLAAVAGGARFSAAVKETADSHNVRRRLLYEAARKQLESEPG